MNEPAGRAPRARSVLRVGGCKGRGAGATFCVGEAIMGRCLVPTCRSLAACTTRSLMPSGWGWIVFRCSRRTDRLPNVRDVARFLRHEPLLPWFLGLFPEHLQGIDRA